MPHSIQLGLIKSHLNTVIENVKQLEAIECNLSSCDATQINFIQERTVQLLEELEKLPCKQVVRIHQQRRQRRRRKKQQCTRKSLPTSTVASSKKKLDSQLPTEDPNLKIEAKNHVALMRQRDAAKMLLTFDLLEKLYEARGGVKTEMSSKFNQMRKIWTKVQNESGQKAAVTTPQNIRLQWETALFGSLQIERVPFREKEKRALLKCRTIWDSYISNEKGAKCIPGGWVLPSSDPSPEWAKYRCDQIKD